MSDNVTITVKPSGPLLLTGPFVLKEFDGTPIDIAGRSTVALCRCGASTTKPFCDGTHSKIGFQAANDAVRDSR